MIGGNFVGPLSPKAMQEIFGTGCDFLCGCSRAYALNSWETVVPMGVRLGYLQVHSGEAKEDTRAKIEISCMAI